MRLNSVWARLTSFLSKHLHLLLVVALLVPSIIDIFRPGYFPMHDDLQVFRLYEVHKCVLDGQIPCRWVPDAGFGYGYPLMQFYPPMPYYPMEILVLLGFGYFFPVKVMFALAFILSGVGMYFLAKEFFGKWGGLLSAVAYVYAPYHSVDIYVRGAMNEGWGMVWFPFVLLFLYRTITQKNPRNLYWFAVALALQLTSHNVMTLVFAPTAMIWALYWLWQSKKWTQIKSLILGGMLGIGLSAFFFIPVTLEQKFVHVDSMMVGYFNYLAHFADIKQLFISRFWGYGGSTWGPNDGMSFSIGHLQWLGACLAALFAVLRFKNQKTLSTITLMAVIFAFAYAFLTHSKSNFIWERVGLLQYAQFPWRLVALSVFYFSFALGSLSLIALPKVFKSFLLILVTSALIFVNLPYFHFEKHVRLTNAEKFSGLQWELQVTGGIFDYLPRSAPKPPGDPAFTIPQYNTGYGGILNFRSGTNWYTFDAHVSSPSAKIMLPLYVYPGLVTKVNNQRVTPDSDPHLGRAVISLTQGYHRVSARIGYTPVRIFSDLISLVSLFIIIRLFRHASRSNT